MEIFEISADHKRRTGNPSTEIGVFLSGEFLVLLLITERIISLHDMLVMFKQRILAKKAKLNLYSIDKNTGSSDLNKDL